MNATTIGAAALIVMTAVFSGAGSAQATLDGQYSGNYVFAGTRNPATPIGIAFSIESSAGGTVKGVLTSHGKDCGGEFPVEGTVEGATLVLRSTAAGGRLGGCN